MEEVTSILFFGEARWYERFIYMSRVFLNIEIFWGTFQPHFTYFLKAKTWNLVKAENMPLAFVEWIVEERNSVMETVVILSGFFNEMKSLPDKIVRSLYKALWNARINEVFKTSKSGIHSPVRVISILKYFLLPSGSGRMQILVPWLTEQRNENVLGFTSVSCPHLQYMRHIDADLWDNEFLIAHI